MTDAACIVRISECACGLEFIRRQHYMCGPEEEMKERHVRPVRVWRECDHCAVTATTQRFPQNGFSGDVLVCCMWPLLYSATFRVAFPISLHSAVNQLRYRRCLHDLAGCWLREPTCCLRVAFNTYSIVYWAAVQFCAVLSNLYVKD